MENLIQISYSEELGINLKSKKSSEIFKWFIASILFGARISEIIAKNTYRALEKYDLLTPESIIKAGRDFLVSHVMAEGGYVRYDGKTSSTLIEISKKLIKEYDGDLNKLYQAAKDSKDLENKLENFKGIGPITVNIFLRELRGIWKKSDSDFSKYVLIAAKHLGIKDIKGYWKKHKVKGKSFVNFEASLVRIGKDLYHKNKMEHKK